MNPIKWIHRTYTLFPIIYLLSILCPFLITMPFVFGFTRIPDRLYVTLLFVSEEISATLDTDVAAEAIL